MLGVVIKGLRRWTAQQIAPAYEILESRIDRDGAEIEPKDEAAMENGILPTSSSRSSSPHQKAEEYGLESDHNEPTSTCMAFVVFGPKLVLRSLLLVYLLITEPFRRQARLIASAWPPIYDRLGGAKCLVPSFWQPSDPSAPPRRLHPSAWLDGLRGSAAFLVAWHHASLLWYSNRIHQGWRNLEDEGSYTMLEQFIQLPFVRLVVSGPPQVAVFFIISGYALSYKPLRLARMGRFAEAGDAIHSSVFRRHPRLYIMPVVVSFVAALMIHFDLYGTTEDGWKDTAVSVRRPPRMGTFVKQMIDWVANVRHMTDPLSPNMERGRPFGYDANLWTLPVEFDCSMFIFLCQAAFLRLRPRIRLLFLVGLLIFAISYVHWQLYLFIAGMFLCDLHFHLDGTSMKSANESSSGEGNFGTPSRRRRTIVGIVGFILALYLLSAPETYRAGATSYGYRTLYAVIPEIYNKSGKASDFWLIIGGTLLVYSIDRTPLLQRIFNHPFPQYLGKISYSLYLVHGPLIFSIGHWIVRKTTAFTGMATHGQYGAGIALAALGLWPIIIYCADAAMRGVDVRAVALPRKLYEKWVVKEQPEQVAHAA